MKLQGRRKERFAGKVARYEALTAVHRKVTRIFTLCTYNFFSREGNSSLCKLCNQDFE